MGKVLMDKALMGKVLMDKVLIGKVVSNGRGLSLGFRASSLGCRAYS